jgi:hypothetical protein
MRGAEPKWEKESSRTIKEWNRMLLSSGSSGQTMVRQKKKVEVPLLTHMYLFSCRKQIEMYV